MRSILLSFVCVLLLLATALKPAQAEEQVMLVLDASGSMWGQIEGTAKISIARAALKSMVSDWPKDRVVGLIAYGHRSKGDCNDIETVFPLGPLNAALLGKTVDALTPKGKTPLTAAVKLAAEELKYEESKATVILISDGIETCDLDPCKVGPELEKLGLNFTAHVIGFDVSSIEDQKGLKCLAESTGGKFIAAGNASELNQALSEAAKAIVEATPEPSPEASPVQKPKPLKAELNAPESGIKGTEVNVELKGEKGIDGFLYIYAPNGTQSLGYKRIEADDSGEGYKTITMRLPGSVGDYVFRVKDAQDIVLAERPIKAIDAAISIQVSPEVAVGTEADYSLTAPPGLDGYVYLYAEGKEQSIAYVQVRAAADNTNYEKAKIRVPATPGDYVLKWKSGAEEVLAEAPFRVVAAAISLTVQAEAAIGTEVEFTPTGPAGLDGYVYLYAKGKENSISYERILEDEKVAGYQKGRIRLPTVPGEYVLRWKSGAEQVLAEAFVKATNAEVSLEHPAEASLGTELTIKPKGPNGLTGYIYLYAAGKKDSVTYARVVEDAVSGYADSQLVLPAKPGEYILKWQSQGDGMLAESKLNVLAAELSLLAPEEVSAEEEFEVNIKAPAGIRGYVYLYRAGKKDSITYYRVLEGSTSDYKTLEVRAPKEPGDYELRWQIGNKEIIATKSFKVVPGQ